MSNLKGNADGDRYYSKRACSTHKRMERSFVTTEQRRSNIKQRPKHPPSNDENAKLSVTAIDGSYAIEVRCLQ